MNILLICLDKVGIMHYGVDLANNLANKGYSVIVIGYNPINVFLNKKIISFTIPERSFRELWQIFRRTLCELKPDVIHFTGFHPYFILLSLYAKKFTKIPIVLTLHDAVRHYSSNRPPLIKLYKRIITGKIFFRLLISLVSEIVALSSYESGKIKAIYGRESSIIPLSQDISRYEKYIAVLKNKTELYKENQIKLLFFGTIDKYKGLEYIIKACEILVEKNINFLLTIAGRAFSYNLEIPSPIKKYVRFENKFIPEQDIPTLFLNSDIVLLPYIEVTQSGVLPLAFAFGKVVIATCIGSFPEIIKDGINGFLVSPKSPDEIAQVIIKLYFDRNLLQKISKNVERDYKQILDWSYLSDRYLKLYEKLVLKRRDTVG